MGKIDDFSLSYELLRCLYFRWAFNHVYYKNHLVIGEENLPHNRPVILAPNHQNTLLDALVFVSILKEQPVFLARQDVFKPGLISRILTWLKIMPVYRIRDGFESLSKNEEIFRKSAEVLWNNHILCLMPEGNHGNRRHLRPLVKGLFRIAMMAQEKYGTQPGVVIVPVGLEYSHYYHIQSTFIVNFRPPIEVNEYYELYRNDPAKALLALREKLAGEMSQAMIDIRNQTWYETIYFLQQILPEALKGKRLRSRNELKEKFHASREWVRKLDKLAELNPGTMEKLHSLAQEYQQKLSCLGLRDWLFIRPQLNLVMLASEGLLWLLLLPFFLFGAINLFPLYALANFSTKNIKDKQFYGAVMFTVAWLAAPLYALLLFTLVCLFARPSVAAIYLAAVFISAFFTMKYFIAVKKWLGKIRYFYFHAVHQPVFTEAMELRNRILEIIKQTEKG